MIPEINKQYFIEYSDYYDQNSYRGNAKCICDGPTDEDANGNSLYEFLLDDGSKGLFSIDDIVKELVIDD